MKKDIFGKWKKEEATIGYDDDHQHPESRIILERMASIGVGTTAQYLEQIGRRVVGGVFGQLLGGMLGSLARGATGAAFSFATTYALGQVARTYYAGGRTLSTQMLHQTFTEMLAQGKSWQGRYAQQNEQQARTVDVARLVHAVRSE